jgi:NADPH-dependent glutamate synthase beta subunit-like oxidoreductase
VRKRTISVALIVASLILIMAAPQRGQTALGQSSDNARATRSVAIDTLRAINAVEYAYRSTHGTFASWDVLAVSEEFVVGVTLLSRVHRNSRMRILRSGPRFCRDGRSAST